MGQRLGCKDLQLSPHACRVGPHVWATASPPLPATRSKIMSACRRSHATRCGHARVSLLHALDQKAKQKIVFPPFLFFFIFLKFQFSYFNLSRRWHRISNSLAEVAGHVGAFTGQFYRHIR